MTDAISIQQVRDEQKVLQAEFEEARQTVYDAKEKYTEAKAVLMKFNNKFGRVLEMMKED